ncbi:Zinc finger CCHC-type [Arabidopsis thaliana x Arabidopsis arenosa]|uniref:Protein DETOXIFICATION n=1 Tax=Arabidopsis thaliana x Arabidopsis arenosa TaxID=1240361 RepID=A0A8T1XMR9_9BRAS|nr:Zinc finger CCHC-type [Arabidopsis thaliana x Arabidopsis arenosa]
MEIQSLPFKKRFSWNEGNRSLHGLRVNGKREELGTSSKDIQCFECKGFGHVRLECANLLKPKKKKIIMNNSETDSDDGEELKSFVAFTTFESTSVVGGVSASVSGSASASATGAVIESDNDQSDDDAASISDEEFHENYKALYEHWLKMVEENSVLTKEKLKLEAKVIEAQKYAAEKEEEASQAKVQLEETQKNLRMLNNGTKKLDHILNIGKTDKCGLGFKGSLSKSDPAFVYGGKITSASGTDTETAAGTAINAKTVSDTRTDTKSDSGKVKELQSAPRRVFRPVCHHCGVVGHIRPRCFRLLRERNRMENAYDVRFHGPTCYHCGVQGHIKRNCFRFIRESSHEGLRRRKIWVRKDDFYGDCVLGYQPRVSTRVGNELGSNLPQNAKRAAIVGLGLGIALGFLSLTFTVSFKDKWATYFTDDKYIIALTAEALPFVGFCELGNCLQTAGCGILRGSARPRIGATINGIAFYAVGIPVGLVMAFCFGFGFNGFWIGMITAQTTCAIFMMVVICRTDWELEARRANELTAVVDSGNNNCEENVEARLVDQVVVN